MNDLENFALDLTADYVRKLFVSFKNNPIRKKQFLNGLKERLSNIDFSELVQDVVFDLAPQFGLIEEPISEEEALLVLGVASGTLKKYREEGMPYIKSRPNKYKKSEILAWQRKHKKINTSV